MSCKINSAPPSNNSLHVGNISPLISGKNWMTYEIYTPFPSFPGAEMSCTLFCVCCHPIQDVWLFMPLHITVSWPSSSIDWTLINIWNLLAQSYLSDKLLAAFTGFIPLRCALLCTVITDMASFGGGYGFNSRMTYLITKKSKPLLWLLCPYARHTLMMLENEI